MSAYSKLFANSADIAEGEVTDIETKAPAEITETISKGFDDYGSDKLKDIYNEIDLDTMTIPEVSTRTVVRAKASTRLKVYTATLAIIAVMFAVLAIYNIFVINSYSTSIQCLQQDVMQSEYNLQKAKDAYNTLVDNTNVQNELTEMGYSEARDMIYMDIADKAEVTKLVGETNWFDNFCKFLSSVFGG